ncbi:hypothetical protein [Streptococcus equinus]|uniref:hypothetical protein n=1 Tax=Streptococcus equinus TaxID=1335 RepID=UPI001FB4577A|nr:hypothetical protein [Streptococcus equinus]UOC10555.1 hypothetical protein KIP81_06505 [Streptococcus equinus]
MYVEKNVTDKMENVLLDNTPITEENSEVFERANEFVENYEGGIVPDYSFRTVSTEAGKLCFMNNITEIDIFEHEDKIQQSTDAFKKQGVLIDNTADLFEIIFEMFLSKSNEDSMKRFEHEETRRFYKMFLDWRITNTSLNQMISSFMRYWKGLLSEGKSEALIFVGRWGDVFRGGVRPLWTDIANKTDEELINLAIVRIKEEQDYLDNILIKYVEVLNDLGMLEERLYLLIKYGTDDKRVITCMRNGISLSLAKLLIEKYEKFLVIDDNDTISFHDDIIDYMRKSGENEVMICELSYFCN